MKRLEKSISILFLLICFVVMVSCSDDKDEPEVQQPPQTTYTITTVSSILEKVEAGGFIGKLDFTIYEYNGNNEVVNIQKWEDIPDGQSTKKYTADRKATKLVIRLEILGYENGKEVHLARRYFKTVYHLSENENINVLIDGNSRLLDLNPITNRPYIIF